MLKLLKIIDHQFINFSYDGQGQVKASGPVFATGLVFFGAFCIFRTLDKRDSQINMFLISPSEKNVVGIHLKCLREDI